MNNPKDLKKRENHRIIFSDLAYQRIEIDLCPACGKPKEKWTRRKDWRCCSVECTERFWENEVKVKSWQHLRYQCFERDGWQCKICGKQPTKHITLGYEPEYSKILHIHYSKKERCNIATIVDALVADHIIPIALGGEEWDINNLQTLCSECHKKKTKEDIKKIAELRKIIKIQSTGQTLLTQKF